MARLATTPLIEGSRIYVTFGAYGTACLNTQIGKRLWERRDLKRDHRVRPSSSPILDEKLLFLVFDGTDTQFIVALDKTLGDTLWQRERQSGVDFETINTNHLRGLIPFSGQAITHFTIRVERGIPDTQPVVDALAPMFHVRKDAPPILMITGDRNQELLGRYEENAYMWRMFKQVEHPDAELFELQGFDHGGMAEPAFPLLLKFVRRHSDSEKKPIGK